MVSTRPLNLLSSPSLKDRIYAYQAQGTFNWKYLEVTVPGIGHYTEGVHKNEIKKNKSLLCQFQTENVHFPDAQVNRIQVTNNTQRSHMSMQIPAR